MYPNFFDRERIETQNLGKAQALGALPAVAALRHFYLLSLQNACIHLHSAMENCLMFLSNNKIYLKWDFLNLRMDPADKFLLVAFGEPDQMSKILMHQEIKPKNLDLSSLMICTVRKQQFLKYPIGHNDAQSCSTNYS